jgi:hypothetical protein
MSLMSVLRRNWHYSVKSPGAGRLVYREANREYTFPIYEEDGAMVLVGTPSSQRTHLFFNWYPNHRDFPDAARRRILPRIAAHLRAEGLSVRIFERETDAAASFEFYPELFEDRNRALELLEEAGYAWFSDFSSIDPIHEDYGLEISGVKEEDVKPIMDALERGFPQWHHHKYSLHDCGREPGWSVILCMFPPKSCNAGSYDGD